jgi:SAM-dependent methyltransferase
MLKDHQDAWGHLMYDYLQGKEVTGFDEDDDGHVRVRAGTWYFFTEYREWPPFERTAIKYARGRILDIGCAAGRHSIYLQEKGLDVLGIDISPLAIEVCKARGLRNAKVMSVNQVNSSIGRFDTVLLIGGNFFMLGNPERAKRLLKKLGRMTSMDGRIIANSLDHYRWEDPLNISRRELNRQRGRMPGQRRSRVCYKEYATPWMDWLFVSKDEMQDILKGTPWSVKRFIDSETASYIAIIDKKKA